MSLSMKFIMVFWFERLHRLWRRSHISLRRDKRLPHGVRRMQTPILQRCRSSSQKIFARQIFFGSPVFILVRTAMRLCSHSHISLRYNASLMYPVRPCRGLFVADWLALFALVITSEVYYLWRTCSVVRGACPVRTIQKPGRCLRSGLILLR